jgi:hypothetical protein
MTSGIGRIVRRTGSADAVTRAGGSGSNCRDEQPVARQPAMHRPADTGRNKREAWSSLTTETSLLLTCFGLASEKKLPADRG